MAYDRIVRERKPNQFSRLSYPVTWARGGGTKKKVGGLTLPLNDCTEAGVQGLHSEEFHDFTCCFFLAGSSMSTMTVSDKIIPKGGLYVL